MSERIEAILDLTDCKCLQELHQRIKTALNFPNYYGCNWDAFWDSLHIDCPVEYVRITGEHTLPKSLQVHLDKMYDILQCCKEERAGWGIAFEYEIVD